MRFLFSVPSERIELPSSGSKPDILSIELRGQIDLNGSSSARGRIRLARRRRLLCYPLHHEGMSYGR